MSSKWDRIAPLGVVVFPMVLFARLLRPYPFESDDFEWVYQRIPGYLDALHEGQFPPRIFPHAFEGGGYAFAHFYPPISHWVATGFAALTDSPVWGVHLSFYASAILASLTMFWLARGLTGSATLGTVGAVMYTALPYHVADVYVRGALAESWSFVWFPLIVQSGVSAVRTGRVIWIFPLSVAGLILTHTVMALYFAFACGLGLIWIRNRCGLSVAMRLLAAAILGASLSLWYVLPSYTMLDGVWAGVTELMQTSEEWVRRAAPRPGDWMFLLDLPPLLMVMVVIKILVQEQGATAREGFEDVAGLLLLVATFTIYAYVPGFYQWLLPDIFAVVQFPWRVFAITGFLCTILTVLLARPLREKRAPVFLVVASCAVALPLALLPGGGVKPVDDRRVEHRADGGTTYTVIGDYLPHPVLLPHASEAVTQVREEAAADGVAFIRHRGTVWANGPRLGGREIVFPLFYYPVYRARTKHGEQLLILFRGGFAAVLVPEEVDSVGIRVSNPPSFWWGLALGLAASLLWYVLTQRCRVQ